MNLTRIRQQTVAAIARRYDAHASRTLRDFLCAPETFEQVEPQQIAFVWDNKRELLDDFAQPNTLTFLSETCIDATLRYTYARNQFLNVPEAYLSLLAQVYQTLFAHLRDSLQTAASFEKFSSEFREVVRQHHARLRTLFGAYCQAIHPEAFAQHPLLATVCCGEYSAPFQFRLFDIDLALLREPILDLGCGSRGDVVAYLRQKGYHAVGLDRMSPNLPGFVHSDWFAFDFQQNTWGTILAHQSFSTHFLHCHLQTPRLAEQYAKLYLRILNSLRSGGSFYYAPGMPFFEPYIHALPQYDVQKISIDSAHLPKALCEISYAVRVKKREQPTNISC